MPNLEITQDGQKFEWWGYLDPRACRDDATKWALFRGRLVQVDAFGGSSRPGHSLAIFVKAPVFHEAGGVTFRETGEERVPRDREWSLSDDGLDIWPFYHVPGRNNCTGPRKILEPVFVDTQMEQNDGTS